MHYYCFVMHQKILSIKSVWLLLAVCLCLQACTYNHLPESNKKIILVWHPAPANQTKQEFTVGLQWLFSYLGAKLPANTFDEGLNFIDENKIEINIDNLGFNAEAIESIMQLIKIVKQSEEYEASGGIDAGRFFALCFNSTYHYYKITGAAKTYNEFSAKYANYVFKTFICDTSSISDASRIFNYTISELNLQKNCFISEEGNGIFSSGAFQKNGFIEAFDYMDNGQPRFVIYNQQGNLYAPADPSSHKAGKPAKCMWCHESGVQPLFSSTPDLAGSVTSTQFLTDQQTLNIKIKSFHQQSNSILNFIDPKAHSQGEFIYLCFYEPDIIRLSQEWQMSEAKVKSLLQGVAPHNNPEFPFLKEVYYRSEIQKFAPFKAIEVSDEMREATAIEPNYLQ